MNIVSYVGLDVHRKSISYCIKRPDGTIVREGDFKADRFVLQSWAKSIPGPWAAAMEATLVSSWIYRSLKPLADQLLMGNPARMKAITAGKKKSDKIDARTIADLLRCDLLPAVWVPPPEIEDLRRKLRFRSLVVEERTVFKNRIAGCLLETGVPYETRKLHGQRYFRELVNANDMAPETRAILDIARKQVETLNAADKLLIAELRQHPVIAERFLALCEIPSVGTILALTWVLEAGDPRRFPNIGKACSYCGLTSALRSSAGKDKCMPISKQRNGRLQHILVEAAKVAPMWNPLLKEVHDKEAARGDANTATLAVARKLVAYMMAVDRRTIDAIERRQREAANAKPAAVPARPEVK